MEEDTFSACMETYAPMVFRIAYSYLKDRGSAEDVVQEVFLKLYAGGRMLPEPHLRHWLVRVTLNECKAHLRSWWNQKVTLAEELPENAVPVQEERLALLEAIFRLPRKERVILYLFYYEGYQAVEIGKLLSMNPVTVRARLMRSREKLRYFLAEEEH